MNRLVTRFPMSWLRAPAVLTLLAASLAATGSQAQEKVLRIAMTAGDIPRTLGQPDQGFEGNRFTGIPMYDSLTQWDLSTADAPSVLIPALDAMDQIKQRGFKLYSNAQPHVWPWQLSFAEGSPWLDKRVRQAANLCVDREGLKQMLGGMMAIPKGTVPPGHPWWGNPAFDIKYDVKAAQALMSQAGFSAAKPVKVKVQISASGSGQMQPLPMNEFVQQSLKQCFFDVQFDVIEWNTLFTNWRKGSKDPSANGSNAINVSFAAMDPFFAMVRFVSTKTFPPVSNNWGYFGNAEIDKLVADARTSFDDKARDAALAKLHARIVDEAPFVWIAHDVGPRALSAKVKNVVQPRSWFIDIATMTMD